MQGLFCEIFNKVLRPASAERRITNIELRMKKIWGASSGMTLLYEIVGQGFSLAIFLAI